MVRKVQTQTKENGALLECPVRFLWGSFCRSVLSEGNSRTLYDITPGMRIEGFPKKGVKKETDIKLGKFALFAVFERVDSKNVDALTTNVEVELEEGALSLSEFEVTLGEKEHHFQLTMYVDPMTVRIPTKLGQHEITVLIRFKFKGKELGSVPFRIFITNLKNEIDAQRPKKSNRVKG